MSQSRRLQIVGLALIVFFAIVILFPHPANALSKDADAMCIPADPPCPCHQIMTQKGCQMGNNKFQCPCWDTTNGHVTMGKCISTNVCKGETGDGQGLDSGMSQLMKALGDLLGKLKGGGGDSPPPSPTTPPPTNGTGCVGAMFQTSDISQLSNPCAQYVPSVSGTLNTTSTIDTGGCSILAQALGQCTSDTGTTTDTTGAGTGTDTGTTAGTDTSSTTTQDRPIIFATTSDVGGITTSGERGDITTTDGGGTVLAGMRDEGKNIEVAGFYGSDTGTQPQGLVAGWCQSRPWASNFLGKIVSTKIFDSLCAWRGYQVGMPPASAAPVLQQTIIKGKNTATTTTTTTSTGPVIPAKVFIRAVPASVPIGSRTSIFWNTQGVTHCTEMSPGGNFNQNSLSGGAATVPIITATTFTITCIASDGATTTDSVTVNLKI